MPKNKSLQKLFGMVVGALLGIVLVSRTASAQTEDPAGVKRALAGLANDERALKTLKVTYDDLHPMHGGLTLTIYGDGRIEQKSVREKVGKPRQRVENAELRRLVAVLLEVSAWKQQTPDRTAVPDESHARLFILVDGKSASIWEWYNELQKEQRIFRVRELMKSIAWKSP